MTFESSNVQYGSCSAQRGSEELPYAAPHTAVHVHPPLRKMDGACQETPGGRMSRTSSGGQGGGVLVPFETITYAVFLVYSEQFWGACTVGDAVGEVVGANVVPAVVGELVGVVDGICVGALVTSLTSI